MNTNKNEVLTEDKGCYDIQDISSRIKSDIYLGWVGLQRRSVSVRVLLLKPDNKAKHCFITTAICYHQQAHDPCQVHQYSLLTAYYQNI
ncbi:hypothetical protein INR49_002267 [Caranx melampygus]|nr:hypothetical protein INR49_002267 [Caranx melampygus]